MASPRTCVETTRPTAWKRKDFGWEGRGEEGRGKTSGVSYSLGGRKSETAVRQSRVRVPTAMKSCRLCDRQCRGTASRVSHAWVLRFLNVRPRRVRLRAAPSTAATRRREDEIVFSLPRRARRPSASRRAGRVSCLPRVVSNPPNAANVDPACLFCPAGPTAAARLQRRGLCRSPAKIRQTGPGPGRRRPVRRTETHRDDAQGVHVDHRAAGQAQGGPEARLFQVRVTAGSISRYGFAIRFIGGFLFSLTGFLAKRPNPYISA